MLDVLRGSWALFLGIMLVAIGGALLATLLAVHGTIEGFSPFSIGFLMTGHFIGYILGAIIIPKLILRIGHVRAFASVASVSSVVFLLFPVFPNLTFWYILRVCFGFCISGFLLVAARRLNNVATIKTSGQMIFIYLIVQTGGLALAQVILNFASVEGFDLFIIGSIILSLSLVPLILSYTRTELNANKGKESMKLIDITPLGAVAAFVSGKTFHATKAMGMKDLIKGAPLGAVGMFFQGGLLAAMSTMAAVFGMLKEFSIPHLTLLCAIVYIGAGITQYPIGWLSDRMDRRWLIVIITLFGGFVCFYGAFIGNDIILLSMVMLVFGGVLSPMYSLYMAHAKDILGEDRMEAASGMLRLFNVLGGIIGVMVAGAVMTIYGADAYFIYISAVMGLSTVFTLYHIIRRHEAGVPVKAT